MASSERYNGAVDFEPLHPDSVVPRCNRCSRVAYYVYQASCCGAYFCEGCKGAQSQSVTCTRCQRRLGDIHFDFNETQKRYQLEVHCRNKRAGCSYTDQRGRMDDHLRSCLYELVPCKHEKCKQKIFRKELQKHEETCPDRIVQCQFCKASLRAIHLNQYHMYTGCQDFPKDCRNKCGEKVTDRQLSKHRGSCPCEPIPCLLARYGCTETVQRNHMSQHLHGYKHMELLLQEIEKLRTNQLSKEKSSQQTIWSLQKEVQNLHKNQLAMQDTIQLLLAEVQSLRNNYSRTVLEDAGRLRQSQRDLHTQVIYNHQQLTSQFSIMEEDFQRHKKAYEKLMDERKMIQDGIIQANTIFPVKFIVNNTEELVCKGESCLSPDFYTICLRHRLRLAVFPGGTGNYKGHYVSVWLYRLNNFGIQNDQLPERVKIQVVIELINQLPHSTEADNHVINIDTIVHQNQQDEVIFKKDDFISIEELDHRERRRRYSFAIRHTQYKKDNSMLFAIKSAMEGVL